MDQCGLRHLPLHSDSASSPYTSFSYHPFLLFLISLPHPKSNPATIQQNPLLLPLQQMLAILHSMSADCHHFQRLHAQFTDPDAAFHQSDHL